MTLPASLHVDSYMTVSTIADKIATLKKLTNPELFLQLGTPQQRSF